MRLDNLQWGTRLENAADKVVHGTVLKGDRHWLRLHPEAAARGEKNGLAKLTAERVAEAKRRRANGESLASLSREYGVSRTAVRLAIQGRNWRYVARAAMSDGERIAEIRAMVAKSSRLNADSFVAFLLRMFDEEHAKRLVAEDRVAHVMVGATIEEAAAYVTGGAE